MMSASTEVLESSVELFSLAADSYNRYPGESVTFFLRFIAPEQTGATLRFAMPKMLKVESYVLPDGIPISLPSVIEVDHDLVVLISLEKYFNPGQQYETIVQTRIDSFYVDHYALAEARLLDINMETITAESVRVAVLSRGKYLEFLPELYGSDDFTSRFLMLFESFWKPINQQIDQIENYFDPDLTPPDFIPWLSSWIGLPVDSTLPVKRMRKLLNNAMYLFQRRGTLQALKTTLKIYTEGEIEISERRANNFVLGAGSSLGVGIALGRANQPNFVSVTMRLPQSELERTKFSEEMYQHKMKEVIRGLVPAHTVFDLNCEFHAEQG
jgi:phage tail-like protein